MTDPIVAFLNAREGEREREAREAGPSWQRHPACAADDPGVMVFDDDHSYPLVVNPAWVLADVEAKRAILAEHIPGKDRCDEHDASFKSVPCPTLLALVSIWSDHPDFDPSWAS